MARERGFTLIELMITLAVATTLLLIAVPGYQRVIQRSAMAGAASELAAALNFARTAAVARNERVHMCRSDDGVACADPGGDWRSGWIVFVRAGQGGEGALEVLRRFRPEAAGVHITGMEHVEDGVTFGASGFAIGSAGTFRIRARTGSAETRVLIAGSGRIRIESGEGA